MRVLLVSMAIVALASAATARVWTRAYRCDETTPLAALDANHPTVYRDIMVGTHLVFVISSDDGADWTGALLLSWDDANDATLSGRGYVPGPPPTYAGSCLDAAGTRAAADDYIGPEGLGLVFQNDGDSYQRGYQPAVTGDWFICDYRAEQVGRCDVSLYVPFPAPDMLSETFSFTHVASRDFNGDGIVNFRDLVPLAARWHSPIDPSSADAGLDLDADLRIDSSDLARFTEHWLERMDCQAPAVDAGK